MIIGKTFKLDDVGNIKLTKDGSIEMIEDKENVGQTCTIHLLTIQGEDEEAPWMGNPYMRMLFLSQDVKGDDFLEMSCRIALNPDNIDILDRVENIEMTRTGDRSGRVDIKVIDKNGQPTDIRTRFDK